MKMSRGCPPWRCQSCWQSLSLTPVCVPTGSASKRSIRTVDKLVPVKRLLATSSRPSMRPHADQFGDLIEQMLVYDPAKRMTARQALRHPFFREQKDDDGADSARARKSASLGRE